MHLHYIIMSGGVLRHTHLVDDRRRLANAHAGWNNFPAALRDRESGTH